MNKLFVSLLLSTFCLGGLFSGYQIVNWYNDNQKTDNQIKEIQELVKVEEVEDSSSTIIIEEELPSDNEENVEVVPIIETKMLSVDFNKLLQINQETAGWIRVEGTNIDYPFAQAKDNKFYLKHSFDRRYNSSGWVFLDYRNTINELDTNTILYAHGRVDGTMFGTLKNTLSTEWFDNKENHYVKMSTLYNNYVFEVFSVYHIKTTNDYLYNNFSSDENYLDFINRIKSRSVHDFSTSVGVYDKVLTLSTCYNNSEKMVLHAKLVKSEARY